MKASKKPLLLAIGAVALLGQGFLQRTQIFPYWSKNFNQGNVESSGLNPDQFIFALAGFREMIAGILWVRADEFFDQGNYDAILPIIRLVTALDPNEIDVYATGMWHIGYNFTDEEQRSDRRYIPSALALGKEGAKKNPNTYEMFFEVGWMWYHKIDDDYEQPLKWFLKAQEKDDMIPARKNLIGMVYQRNGQPDKALDAYFKLLDASSQKFTKDQSFGNRQNRETIENNIDTTMVRMVQRGWVAQNDKRPTEGYDTNPPFDVGFSVKVSVPEAMVLRVEGTWGVQPVGTRIRMILRDAEYPGAKPAGMDWDAADNVFLDPPRKNTFMQEQLYVRNRRFNKKIDMSKDPTMYPFLQDKYIMEFYYNPRSAPPHIQDRFGWTGEGMTDKNFLNTEIRPGQRVMYTTLAIDKDMILHRGKWADKVPVVMSKNYIDQGGAASKEDQVVLDIPSLRSGK